MGRKKKWADLTDTQKAVIIGVGSVQVALLASAWADLATRPAEEVNGSKGKWALICLINIAGPLAYFAKGRRIPLAVTADEV